MLLAKEVKSYNPPDHVSDIREAFYKKTDKFEEGTPMDSDLEVEEASDDDDDKEDDNEDNHDTNNIDDFDMYNVDNFTALHKLRPKPMNVNNQVRSKNKNPELIDGITWEPDEEIPEPPEKKLVDHLM